MLHSFLPAISVILLAATCVNADDYLLRIETIGFRDRPQREEEPTQEILESIEIVTRVNQPFYGSSTIGAAKISINGRLEQSKDGSFRVQFRYRKSRYSGESITGPKGLENPATESKEINLTSRVELQRAVELGGGDKVTTTQDGSVLRTKTRSVLSLVKYDPEGN
jgi:hypothetical protein